MQRLKTLATRALGDTGKLMAALGLFFVAWGTIAPISTLSWWLQDGDGLASDRPDLPEDWIATNDGPLCYLVFLTGVGDVSGEDLAPGEAGFLDAIETEIPHCPVVRDVFPYSAASSNIGGQPIFRGLWDLSEQLGGDSPVRLVLQMRNLWRVALSADNRYGRAYNRGTAATIIERMAATKPLPLETEDPFHLVLVGTSGGAQVALGAAPYLAEWLPTEISVVSFGGVFEGRDGFNAAQRVYHIHGEQDWVDNIGALFPSRWRWTWGSPFNQARRAERYQARSSGPHDHDGDRGYFGQSSLPDDDSTTYLDLSIQVFQSLSLWDDLLNLRPDSANAAD